MFNFLKTSADVQGLRTELIVQAFADRILVLVTQVGKVGNLIQASIPPTTPLRSDHASFDSSGPAPEPLPSPPAAIQLTPLFGSASSEHMQTLHSLYAAQIATLVWLAGDEELMGGDRRSVIVGIALAKSQSVGEQELNEQERKVFHGIMDSLWSLISKGEPSTLL
ncbi:hypothetical protein BU15DRAFT_39569 [Melanogaster broomeanus]|nr:hypothetical protein BU15DRAFT_39569 [Melanogaster broomeanus]